jgi:hypothetical protein
MDAACLIGKVEAAYFVASTMKQGHHDDFDIRP